METIHVQPNGNPVARIMRTAKSLPFALKFSFRKAVKSSYLQVLWERLPENIEAMRGRPSYVPSRSSRPIGYLWDWDAVVFLCRWLVRARNRNVGRREWPSR
jgi:hypothetical protein